MNSHIRCTFIDHSWITEVEADKEHILKHSKWQIQDLNSGVFKMNALFLCSIILFKLKKIVISGTHACGFHKTCFDEKLSFLFPTLHLPIPASQRARRLSA